MITKDRVEEALDKGLTRRSILKALGKAAAAAVFTPEAVKLLVPKTQIVVPPADIEIDFINKKISVHGDGTITASELYAWLQDTFDEPAQMNDSIPMTAQTPYNYTMENGWFMDEESMKNLHLKRHTIYDQIRTNSWNGLNGSSDGTLHEPVEPSRRRRLRTRLIKGSPAEI